MLKIESRTLSGAKCGDKSHDPIVASRSNGGSLVAKTIPGDGVKTGVINSWDKGDGKKCTDVGLWDRVGPPS